MASDAKLRGLCAPLIAAVILLVLPAGAAAATGCAQRGVTVDANEHIRVYRVGTRLDHTVYACWLRSEKRRRLGQHEGTFGGVERVAVAGRFVAYELLQCVKDRCRGRVRVMDVHSRTLRKSALIFESEQPNRLTDMLLKRNGSVAWIRGYQTIADWEVRKLDASGEAVLDRGPQVKPGSLALSSSGTLYWANGDQTRSSALE